MNKLSRQDIKEGMKAIPIEKIVLGSNNPNGVKLTKKQKHFAEQLVVTGNKTEAYRRAYKADGKRQTNARNAQNVAKNSHVQTYIMALEAAKQAEEYLLPTRLRALTIHKLSQLALSDEIAPAQQLKALELIGKMTEVALFSERREVVHSLDSNTLKAKLMEAVQLAISKSKSIRTSTKRTAQDLLAEITDVEAKGDGFNNDQGEPPTEVHPPECVSDTAGHLHSIPDNQSGDIPIPDNRSTLVPMPDNQSAVVDSAVTDVTAVGEGVINSGLVEGNVVIETPPSYCLGRKRGRGYIKK